MNIIIKNLSFEQIEADALMIPIPAQGILSKDLALAIKNLEGEELEQNLLEITPFAIGAATILPTQQTSNYSYLLFTPNRINDIDNCKIENIRYSVRTAIVTANLKEFQSLAIPHPGKCSIQIEPKEIARAIIDEIKNFKTATSLEQVIVFDTDENYTAALKQFAFPQK